MAHVTFAERENVCHGPSLKGRQRLQSAPEKPLKSPMPGKNLHTPLPFGRKAFGAVNKKISTPAAIKTDDKKLLKPQETKVKCLSHAKVEEYPEIETFIPYDPLEYLKYSVPEDLIHLSGFALPGLACFPHAPRLSEDIPECLDPLPNVSPMKMTNTSGGCSEVDAFLQTLDELTVELPPEPVTDF
ncbi:securin [Salarias fasciatus]|uniref:Securin n=1 Tax=Salarias fasciatus TaxID=181472 RepID=A0A672GUT0_SALFA|nr:securin [Salarias fasciatus]